MEQLRRWLKCRGLKLNGKRDDLLKRVSDCLKSGNHHTLDPSIDNGKWFAAKIVKESSGIQGNCPLNSAPIIPSTGWRAFPSQNIPSLYNYGHVHYYALESKSSNHSRARRHNLECKLATHSRLTSYFVAQKQILGDLETYLATEMSQTIH